MGSDKSADIDSVKGAKRSAEAAAQQPASQTHDHESIAEAAVFGVPDERLGEEVAVVLVLRPGKTLGEDELRTFLGATLAKHKIPSKIWFRDEPIPRNASGKFLKRELRKELIGE